MSNEYDEIPVRCCKYCLSLDSPINDVIDGERVTICPHCGSAEETTMLIDKWNEAFERKYNVGPYLNLPKGIKWKDIMNRRDIGHPIESVSKHKFIKN